MSKIVDIVFEPIKNAVEELGYELVDIEYKKVLSRNTLIVIIDQIDPNLSISINDCEKVNEKLDPILEKLNPTSDAPYDFNVSSPGLTRAFKTQRDFERNYGKEVDINFYTHQLINGTKQKHINGLLIERKNGTIILSINNILTRIDEEKISKVCKHITF